MIRRSIVVSGLLSLLLWTPVYAAMPQISAQGDQAVAVLGGKPVPLSTEDFPLQPSSNGGLRFMTVDGEQAKDGLPQGLYLFNAKGALSAFLPDPDAEFCSTVSLSPDGKRLAVDFGSALIRTWKFYSYPDMRPLSGEGISYMSGDIPFASQLTWVDSDKVLFSAPKETARQCEYDPCEAVSVMLHAIATNKTVPVLEATDLCNYTLVGFVDGKVTADKTCLPSVDAWKVYPENPPREKVTVPLP